MIAADKVAHAMTPKCVQAQENRIDDQDKRANAQSERLGAVGVVVLQTRDGVPCQ